MREQVAAADATRSRPARDAPAVDGSPADALVVKGRVVDASSLPLAGFELAWQDGSPLPHPSDANGAFEATCPTNSGAVFAARQGWTTLYAARVDASARDVAPVLVAARAIAISGRVVDEAGRAIPNVRVRPMLPTRWRESLEVALDWSKLQTIDVRSDPAGAFALTEVASVAGAFLSFEHPEYRSVRLEQPSVATAGLEVVLVRHAAGVGQLAGQVVDGAGAPIAGAWITAGRSRTQSDETGGFVLPMSEAYGVRTVLAMHRGYLPARVELAATGAALDAREHPFVMMRLLGEPRRLHGRVVDAAGQPVANARVWVADGSVTVVGNRMVTLEGFLGAEPEREPGVTALWPFVRSAEDGSFVIEGLTDRAYEVAAMRDSDLVTAVATAHPGMAPVTVALPGSAAAVAGTVVDRNGAPVAGVQVIPRCWPVRRPYRDDRWNVVCAENYDASSATTGADGRFRFDHLSGDGVSLRIEAATILPVLIGERSGDLATVNGWPTDLQVVVDRRVHVKVDIADPGLADSFRVERSDGARQLIHRFSGDVVGVVDKMRIRDGKSEVFGLPEGHCTIVLMRDGEVLRRVPVDLQAGELRVVRG